MHMASDCNLNLPGYKFIGRPRVNKQRLGVGILIAESIVNQITSHKIDENLELVWIIIKTSKHLPLFFQKLLQPTEIKNRQNSC